MKRREQSFETRVEDVTRYSDLVNLLRIASKNIERFALVLTFNTEIQTVWRDRPLVPSRESLPIHQLVHWVENTVSYFVSRLGSKKDNQPTYTRYQSVVKFSFMESVTDSSFSQGSSIAQEHYFIWPTSFAASNRLTERLNRSQWVSHPRARWTVATNETVSSNNEPLSSYQWL